MPKKKNVALIERTKSVGELLPHGANKELAKMAGVSKTSISGLRNGVFSSVPTAKLMALFAYRKGTELVRRAEVLWKHLGLDLNELKENG